MLVHTFRKFSSTKVVRESPGATADPVWREALASYALDQAQIAAFP